MAQAQILDPVDVEFDSKDLGNGEYELIAKVTMDAGWHVYSVTTPDTSFIIGSDFIFKDNGNFELVGEIVEPKPHCEYDENFMENLCYHEKEVLFKQKIKVRSNSPFEIEGEFTYQTCNDATCLPPEYVEHTFKISPSAAPTNSAKDDASEEESGLPSIGMFASIVAMLGAALLARRD